MYRNASKSLRFMHANVPHSMTVHMNELKCLINGLESVFLSAVENHKVYSSLQIHGE